MNIIISLIRNFVIFTILSYYTLLYTFVFIGNLGDTSSSLLLLFVSTFIYIGSLCSLIYLIFETLYLIYMWFKKKWDEG